MAEIAPLISGDTDPRVISLNLSPYTGYILPEAIVGLDALETLYLSNATTLEIIPPWISKLKNLKRLVLPNRGTLQGVPDEIWDLPKLESFEYDSHESNVEEVDISMHVSIPPSIEKLKHLKTLIVSDVNFLPHEIGNLSALEHLALENYKVAFLPTAIGNLTNLKVLEIEDSYYLRALPESIGNLTNLSRLRIYGSSSIEFLPESIGKLVNLKQLDLIGLPAMGGLQEKLGDLATLEDLNIEQLPIQSLPSSFRNLRKLKTLCLYNNWHFTTLPEWLGDLTLLETLSLSGMPISSVPNSIGNLRKLKSLFLDCKDITSLPTSLGNLRNLELLDLTGTGILKELPDEIGDLTKLNFLMLSGSGIESLPDYNRLKGLQNLRYFRVDDTILEKDPSLREKLAKFPSDFPRVTCLGEINYDESQRDRDILNALYFNRAKNLMFYPYNRKDCEKYFPQAALWPHILASDPEFFAVQDVDVHEKYDESCRWNDESQTREDFIFQVLTKYGLGFLSPVSK